MPAYPPWLNTDGRPPVLDFANARIALLFDSNILEHGYPYVGYVRRIAEARLRGLRLVTLSPFLTNTATAGDWIPIRSQASASLASLALAQQALHDQGRRFASLPQEIANLLQSLDRSFLEKATGLSIETIRELSRRFFGEPGPAASDIPDPAVLLLNIMKGNLKSFGGLYHPGPQMLRVDAGFGDIASLLRDSRNVVFLHQSNPAFSLAHEIRPILRSSERATLVCVDSFMSETTELSDFVLPLASPLETLTITEPFPLHWHFIAATLPVVKPSGSCRSFDDWLVHLAAAISGVAPPLTPRQFATEAVLGNSPGGLAAGEAIYRKHIVVDGPVIQAQFPAIISSLKTRMELIHKLPSMLNAPLRPEQCFLTAFEESVRGPATAPSKWLDEISYSQKIFLHPQRAGRLGIKSGDAITLTGDSGAPVEGIALLFEGVHPDALAIPMHHGHTGYGRVARGDRFSDSDDSDMSRMFWGKNPGINPAGFNGSIVSIRKKRG
jgi:molybdopterin-containing oxidoreductase family iron-sulfur binding subunit